MVNCCVVGCDNRSPRNPELSFHNIPRKPYEKERRKRWFAVINRKNPDGTLWQPNRCSARVCSEHFVGGKVSNIENHPAYVPSIFPEKDKSKQITESTALLRYGRSRRRTRCEPVPSVRKDLQLVEPLQTPEGIHPLTTSVSTQVNFDCHVATKHFEFVATLEADGFSTYCCISESMVLPTLIEKKDAFCGTENVLQVYEDHQAMIIKDEVMIKEEAITPDEDMIIVDHGQHDDLGTTPSPLASTHQTDVKDEADILQDVRPSENCYIGDVIMKDELVMKEEPMSADEDMTHDDPQAELTSICSLASQQANPSTIQHESHSSVRGEKPHACGICDYRAGQLNALKKHLRTHTEAAITNLATLQLIYPADFLPYKADSQEIQNDPLEELELPDDSADDKGASDDNQAAQAFDQQQRQCTRVDPIAKIASFTDKGRQVVEKIARLQALAPIERASSSETITASDRYKVSQAVIAYAIKDTPQGQCPSLTYKQIAKLAKGCAKLFFGESVAIWFNVKTSNPSLYSSTITRGKSKHAKGILWDRINNAKEAWRKKNPDLKKKLAEEKQAKAAERKAKSAEKRCSRWPLPEGVISPRKRGRPRRRRPDLQAQQRQFNESLEMLLEDVDVKILLAWKDYTKVDSVIMGSFKASSARRLAHLQLEGSDVKAYLALFPFFTSPTAGPILLALEFERLYPDVKMNQLLFKLRTYGPAIIHLAKTGSAYKDAQGLIHLYENTTDERCQATAALLALSFAAHTGGYKKTAGEKCRVKQISRLESALSFCSFYSTTAEKEEHHDKLLKEHQYVVEPYVVVIGTHTDVKLCHVRFLDHDLAVDNVLEAIDLCFKCFFVFNLHYPSECEHLWFVVQQLFYGIPRSTGQRHLSASAQLIEGILSYTKRCLSAAEEEQDPLAGEI